jgi:hypothetical protein
MYLDTPGKRVLDVRPGALYAYLHTNYATP